MVTDADGHKHSVTPHFTLTVIPDAPDCAIFARNGIKMPITGGRTVHHRALVGQLDGVRVYIQKGSIVMTKQDLYL